jgi:hypothetical protein
MYGIWYLYRLSASCQVRVGLPKIHFYVDSILSISTLSSGIAPPFWGEKPRWLRQPDKDASQSATASCRTSPENMLGDPNHNWEKELRCSERATKTLTPELKVELVRLAKHYLRRSIELERSMALCNHAT